MKKNLHKKIALLTAVSFFSLTASAQEVNKSIKLKKTDVFGQTSFLSFNENSTYKSNDFEKVFKEQLNIQDGTQFVKLYTETDKLGFTHDKYQMYQNGVKIEFATYTVHSKNGKITAMNGEMYKTNAVSLVPEITSQDALQKAMQHLNAKQYLWDNPTEASKLDNYKKPQGELVLLPMFDDNSKKISEASNLKLAYKFDIYATQPLSRGDVYVDAQTGDVLFYNATIKHATHFGYSSSIFNKDSKCDTFLTQEETKKIATCFDALVSGTAATRYSGSKTIQTTLSGSNYVLKDATRGSGINTYDLNTSTNYNSAVNFTDNDNNWTTAEHTANKDNGALDAHWGAEMTYDYWMTKHNRNSFNNSGATINSYVHYSSNYDNAFWDGSRMTYGDGSGTYFDILTSLDVAAHEIGHAVCTYTANLAYQRESGAMNEGFSDIWGATVEYYAAPNKSTWLIGEDIERRSGHLALRSMSNPKSEGQPDTYGGTYWINPNCGTPTQSNDYCGVHTNSGVLNHWFYILVQGKSGTNDIGSSYNVTGIGMDKAANIAYRLESVYLSANSTFANARTYGIQAATDLYGANSAEVIATTNAFYAVGIGSAYQGATDTQAPTVPTNLIASGTTNTTTTLNWTASTDNVGVVGYDIYQGTSNLGTVTGTSANITGLTASTTYSFSVRAKDAAGNVSGSSNTVNVTTTGSSTGCSGAISSFPYSEGFENTIGAWTQDSADDFDWIVDANGTPSSNTGPSSAIQGTYYIYVEASSPNYSNKKTILNSPCFNLTNAPSATFNFKYHMYGASTMGALKLEASTNNGSTWTEIWSKSGNQGNSWLTANVSLASYIGNTVQLRFVGSTAATWQGDIAVDDVSLTTASAPVCTNVNINMTFDNYPEETSWEILNASNQVVFSGGTYGSQADGSSLTVTKCLDAGCYTFTIKDTYGDGICCSYGNGSYTVTSNGITFASGGTFGASQSTNFCVGTSSLISNVSTTTETQTEIPFSIYPNPVKGDILNVQIGKDLEDYKIYNIMGQLVLQGKISNGQINVSSLNTGVFIIETNTYKEKIAKKFIKE
ncbi:M4 family metallopeptidase [Flavobacterium sp. N2270]|uniref:M4 family metallopeptidase n=1 Tax=Flavobacterium sp. N2270 TaxID=2986831 RepID=UPI0022253BCD|nr:M4 family metallopeptidase [Flavobacterium sp. N2270]